MGFHLANNRIHKVGLYLSIGIRIVLVAKAANIITMSAFNALSIDGGPMRSCCV